MTPDVFLGLPNLRALSQTQPCSALEDGAGRHHDPRFSSGEAEAPKRLNDLPHGHTIKTPVFCLQIPSFFHRGRYWEWMLPLKEVCKGTGEEDPGGRTSPGKGQERQRKRSQAR